MSHHRDEQKYCLQQAEPRTVKGAEGDRTHAHINTYMNASNVLEGMWANICQDWYGSIQQQLP